LVATDGVSETVSSGTQIQIASNLGQLVATIVSDNPVAAVAVNGPAALMTAAKITVAIENGRPIGADDLAALASKVLTTVGGVAVIVTI
jgi:hypothetical protein